MVTDVIREELGEVSSTSDVILSSRTGLETNVEMNVGNQLGSIAEVEKTEQQVRLL